MPLDSSVLSYVWNDTGKEVWNCGFHLYTGQNRRCRKKSAEARLSTLGCRAAAKNPPGSGTSRLVLAHCLSACQHSCYMEDVRSSSMLSRSRRFPITMMHVRDAQQVREPRFDSWMRRSVARKKPWSFTFLLDAGNPYLEKVYKELMRDIVYFERTYEGQTDLDTK